jgi:putative transcriptional regulator
MPQVPPQERPATEGQGTAQMTDELLATLERAGFECFVPLERRSPFDVAARADSQFFLVKILSNIDSLRESQAHDLLALAQSLGATPLIIGEKSKTYDLQDGTVYERYGVQTVTLNTFSKLLLKKEKPATRYYKGRIVASIDASKLEGDPSRIASALGVTREALYHYKRESRMEITKARKIEKLLDVTLVKDIDLALPREALPPERLAGYLRRMGELGFEVFPVHRGFDALARERRESLLTDAESSLAYARRKVGFLKSAGSFFESHPTLITEKRQALESLKGVPIIKRSELESAESAHDVLDLVKKRAKKA